MKEFSDNIKKEYLYVLDYCTTSIIEIVVYNPNDDEDIPKILESHGLQEDQCSYMWSSVKLNLEQKVYIKIKNVDGVHRT